MCSWNVKVVRGNAIIEKLWKFAFRGHNIADILKMTISEAKELFMKHPSILGKLDTLEAVGLGYLKLGQAANTLSGGEAQRLKLSLELSRKASQARHFIFWMNQPPDYTGLMFND